MSNKISINIQNYLIDKKINMTELANRLNISRQRVSYILLTKEDKNWKLSNLKMIADALKVDFKEFLLEVVFNERK